jgi:antirestriction protein ArdC
MARNSQEREDVYTRVTNQIIQAIEAGADKWEMPWHSPDAALMCPVNASTGKQYRGVNILSLWVASHMAGYQENTWATFKQWSDLGRKICKGEKATVGVFWKPIEVQTEEASEGESSEQGRYWVAKAFPLFNVQQLEDYVPPVLPERPEHQRIEEAEAFFASLGADIRHGGGRAYYRPSSDHIQMPPFEAFVDPLAYYSTLAHEATHWTGAKSRLDRDLSGRFGKESYAAEELVAELGAAFLAADLGLSVDARDENAAYVQSWLKVLKNDSKAIFTAASLAQRAADFMHEFQSDGPKPSPSLPPRREPEAPPGPQLSLAF